MSYLEQLFGKLRRYGLVDSVRGPGGGYNLARPATTVSVADIITAVDEPIDATKCDEAEFIMLKDGLITFEGNAAELRASTDPYVQTFLS